MGILKRVRGLLLVFGMAFGTSGFSASPVVESVAITTATQDSIYSYELHASDVDGDSLSWSVKGNTAFPSWLSLTSLEEFKTVGTTGFSAGLATYLSLDLDNSDTPYVSL